MWVIDAKRYKGKVEVVKPWFGEAKLKIAGRDQTKLVTGLAKQVKLVNAFVADFGIAAPVHGCFCFVDRELRWRGPPSIDGFLILGRNGLTKRLDAAGALTPDGCAHIGQALAARFPRA